MNELKSCLLLYIFKMSRVELHDIETHFAKYNSEAIRRTLDQMYLYDDTIRIHETSSKIHSVISITDEGRVQATNLQIRYDLKKKEIWKERLIGFVTGVLTSIISGALLGVLTK